MLNISRNICLELDGFNPVSDIALEFEGHKLVNASVSIGFQFRHLRVLPIDGDHSNCLLDMTSVGEGDIVLLTLRTIAEGFTLHSSAVADHDVYVMVLESRSLQVGCSLIRTLVFGELNVDKGAYHASPGEFERIRDCYDHAELMREVRTHLQDWRGSYRPVPGGIADRAAAAVVRPDDYGV